MIMDWLHINHGAMIDGLILKEAFTFRRKTGIMHPILYLRITIIIHRTLKRLRSDVE